MDNEGLWRVKKRSEDEGGTGRALKASDLAE